jgi:putative ABC transport system substrate-binding protein
VDRRRFLLTSLAVLAAPLAAGAQQAGKVYRVGILHLTSSTPPVDAFRNALLDLGWLEGQTFIIDYRGADGKAERLEELAAERVGWR